MRHPVSTGPLIAASTFLGLGLGGFIDGIVLHHLLQWHQMISHLLPPDTLERAKLNLFWDGIFHLVSWLLTLTGVLLLWRLAGRRDIGWSHAVFAGGLIFGWGLFNVIDGIFNHYLFGLHNIREDAAHPQLWNHGFLAFGLILAGLGWGLIHNGRGRVLGRRN
jgi:uncharacterized membrane protein